MEKDLEGHTVSFDEEKIIVVGPSFEFWLNEEDDVYDELYSEKTKTRTDLFTGGKLPKSAKPQ